MTASNRPSEPFVHVTRYDNGWGVFRKHDVRPYRATSTKERAILVGQNIAEVVRVLNDVGKIVEEHRGL